MGKLPIKSGVFVFAAIIVCCVFWKYQLSENFAQIGQRKGKLLLQHKKKLQAQKNSVEIC